MSTPATDRRRGPSQGAEEGVGEWGAAAKGRSLQPGWHGISGSLLPSQPFREECSPHAPGSNKSERPGEGLRCGEREGAAPEVLLESSWTRCLLPNTGQSTRETLDTSAPEGALRGAPLAPAAWGPSRSPQNPSSVQQERPRTALCRRGGPGSAGARRHQQSSWRE